MVYASAIGTEIFEKHLYALPLFCDYGSEPFTWAAATRHNMTQLNVDNFTAETGKRFRVNNIQKARIEITKLDDAQRAELATIVDNKGHNDTTNFFGLSSKARWIDKVEEVLANWNDSSPLTREGAFQEFMDAKGLDRLQNQKPDVPNEVFLEEGLTLDNFEDKVFAAIGVKRRFRVSRDQHARIDAGELTREGAFQETVERIRGSHAYATEETTTEDETVS